MNIILANHAKVVVAIVFIKLLGKVIDHIMLVNQKAYWLIHPKGKYEWDFMFSKTNTFAEQHPKIWEQIENNKELDRSAASV